MATDAILELVTGALPKGWQLRPGQVEAIRGYSEAAQSGQHNIAVHLPTGYGKTLVGLAIADWRRQQDKAKPVWLCPTRQLVHQVVERATELGIAAHAFVGPLERPEDRNAYERWSLRRLIAVMPYQRIFVKEINKLDPGAAREKTFGAASFAVLDDVHRAEQAVSDYWTLTLDRTLRLKDRAANSPVSDEVRNPAYFQLLEFIHRFTQSRMFRNLKFERDGGPGSSRTGQYPVYLVPFTAVAEHVDTFKDYMNKWLRWKSPKQIKEDFPDYDERVHHDPLFFERQVWSNIKEQMYFMHIFVTRERATISPFISPVGRHPVWDTIQDRLFMSATMRIDGEIEKLFGVEHIQHVAQEVDVVDGTGRRVIIGVDPDLSLDGGENELNAAVKRSERLIIITPGTHTWKSLQEKAPSIAEEKQVFTVKETEESRDEFLDTSNSILQYYGRYEGLDIPNAKCRLVLLYGIPLGLTPVELFVNYQLECAGLIAPRIASRLEQGLGRCNRQPQDFSLVLLDQDAYSWMTGNEDLISRFVINEMNFSLDALGSVNLPDRPSFVEAFELEEKFRARLAKTYDETITGTERCVAVGGSPPEGTWLDEVAYSRAFSERDHRGALDAARRVAQWFRKDDHQPDNLKKAAWWLYLAGIAQACLDRKPRAPFDYDRALSLWGDTQTYLEQANLPEEKLEWWLGDLIGATTKAGVKRLREALATKPPKEETVEAYCLNRQADIFAKLVRDGDLTIQCFELQRLLQCSKDRSEIDPNEGARMFARGLETLGIWLGFDVKGERTGRADGVWWATPSSRPQDNVILIFEAKSSEQGTRDHPVNRESLQQLDAWQIQETEEFGLTREKLFLVRVGRKGSIVTGRAHEDIVLEQKAEGKSILVLDDLCDFADRLQRTFEMARSLAMKQRDIVHDSDKIRCLLHYYSRIERSSVPAFLSLLGRRTFKKGKR